MSGFGGFGVGSTTGGLFGEKPPEQASGGFRLPTTTTITTTSGLTLGTPTFGTGGTGLFGAQQQTTGFGTAFGAKPAQAGTGFTLNAPTTNTSTITFGSTSVTTSSLGVPASTTAPAFSTTTASSTLPKFSSLAPTNPPAFGTTNLTLKTTGISGFTAPTTTATAQPTFNFGLTTSSTTPTPPTFSVPTTAVATTVTITSAAPTLTFGASTTSATTTSTPATGFTLSQPTTTASLTFGVPKTTKGLTFGTATSTFNVAATTTASLGTGLFGVPKTTDIASGATTITTSAGLGGLDNKQTTQGLSGGTLEPKQTKDHTLPDPILQTLNEFQNFTKQQKSLSVEISHGSSKPLKKVQDDTEAMESLLTMITSGLTRNAIAVDKLKTETAQGLHQAEMAQRNHETPPGLDYDNSAPADYFNDLVTKFETDTVRLRVQIEASEKHLRSLTQSSTISPQELTLAMRRLHETLIVLAARVQALHTSVQSQKEQFKNLRRVYFKDDTNVFESETDQNLVKNKTTIYSLRSLTGPTPFSENPNTGPALLVDGLAMLASSTCTSTPSTSANASWMSDLQGTANTSNILSNLQPMGLPGFQLSKPPTGNKRSRR